MFVPLQELENLAPGTWYVNVLAAYPDQRGQGLGTELLAVAGKLAAEAGSRGLSIIVSDANTGARRLYERSQASARLPDAPKSKTAGGARGVDWVQVWLFHVPVAPKRRGVAATTPCCQRPTLYSSPATLPTTILMPWEEKIADPMQYFTGNRYQRAAKNHLLALHRTGPTALYNTSFFACSPTFRRA